MKIIKIEIIKDIIEEALTRRGEFILSVLCLLVGLILFWLYIAPKSSYKVFKKISTQLKKSFIFLNSMSTLVKKSLIKFSRELLLLLLLFTIILSLILVGRAKLLILGEKLSPRSNSVSFSQDRKYIASGNKDVGRAKILILGEKLYRSNSVSFSPDGKYIASGNEDGTVDLWDVSSASYLKTFEGHLGAINSISFSPDGKYIASSSEKMPECIEEERSKTEIGDKVIKLWDVDTGICVKTFKGYSDTVTSISFSPDGKYIAGGSLDGTIKLWDIKDGSCIKTIKAYPREGVTSISFSPQGKYIASASAQVNIDPCSWDEDDEEVEAMAKGTVGIKLWDIENNSCVRTIIRTFPFFKLHNWNREMPTKELVWFGDIICFSPDGGYIASASTRKLSCCSDFFSPIDVSLWSMRTGLCFGGFDSTSSAKDVKAICFSPDGKYFACAKTDFISLWKISLWKTGPKGYFESETPCIQEIKYSYKVRINSICFSPSGKYIAVGNEEGIDIWEVEPKEVKSKGKFIFVGMVHFKDGQWVCYTNNGFYNCSPDGEKHIRFFSHLGNFPAKTFKAIFNRPDIIIKKLSKI